MDYLTAQRTVNVGFLEAPITGSANVSRSLKLPILRPLLQEHHLGAVDCIRLHNHSSRRREFEETIVAALFSDFNATTYLNIGAVDELLEVF